MERVRNRDTGAAANQELAAEVQHGMRRGDLGEQPIERVALAERSFFDLCMVCEANHAAIESDVGEGQARESTFTLLGRRHAPAAPCLPEVDERAAERVERSAVLIGYIDGELQDSVQLRRDLARAVAVEQRELAVVIPRAEQ